MAGPYDAPGSMPTAGPAPAKRRGGSIVGPLILIFIGGVFLLQNMGLLAPNAWSSLWRLAPLILVLFGLELLFKHRFPWLVAIVGLIVIAAALGSASHTFVDQRQPVPVNTYAYTTNLDGATQAAVTVRFGAGELSLAPLENASSTQLASASYAGPDDSIQPTYTVSGNTGRLDYQLNSRGGPGISPFRTSPTQFTVLLNPGVPLTSLTVQTGAAQAQLDLSRLHIQSLDIALGAAQTQLRLPEQGSTAVHISGGASNLTIEVPQGVAAQFRYTGGLSTFNIDQGRFPRVDEGVYRTPDFETNPNRVDVTLETGVTSIQVN